MAGNDARILDLVIADLHERDAKGRRTYGSSLRASSANDSLRFAYEEALDLAMYLRQEIARRTPGLAPDPTTDLRAEVDHLKDRGELHAALARAEAAERELAALRPPPAPERKACGEVGARANLEALASKLPCRTICGEEGPYLSRYTLAALPDGGFVYLHYFHRGDVDRELHSHPWSGSSVILTGGYIEERRQGTEGAYEIVTRTYRPGDASALGVDTFHRVDLLKPDEGCWTLFVTGPRAASWGFWDRDTGVFTPWREALARRGLL